MDTPSSINAPISDIFIYFLLSYEHYLIIYFHIDDSGYFTRQVDKETYQKNILK